MLIEMNNPQLSIRRQCNLLGLNRASFYRRPAGETEFNLSLMRLIDAEYMRHPFLGYRRMAVYLTKHLQQPINPKRTRRLMRLMEIQAIYPAPKTSQANSAHKKYPYLLRGLKIDRPNQVWSTDITYIRMQHGFMYLVAIIDWYSRYVIDWRLSNTLDGKFCLESLEHALTLGKPEIFNTDQGVQFTAHDFTHYLEQKGILVSMDGRGRALDNIFIERLWRTVKYEDIYLKEYETVPMLESGLTDYFHYYSHERPHQSLAYKTPATVYGIGSR